MPALAAGRERISTNHGIARFLDARHPERPLLPDDPEQRASVEEAERWANETLQTATRRLLLAAVVRDPAAFSRSAADGRMGYLLFRRALARRLIVPLIGRRVFVATPEAERELLAPLSALLDRIDAWIEEGVLDGAQLNVADCMVAPSLALALYRPDVMPLFQGGAALELVDRLLPEPAHRQPSRLRAELVRSLDRQAPPGRGGAEPPRPRTGWLLRAGRAGDARGGGRAGDLAQRSVGVHAVAGHPAADGRGPGAPTNPSL